MNNIWTEVFPLMLREYLVQFIPNDAHLLDSWFFLLTT